MRRTMDEILRNELEIKFLTDYVYKSGPFSNAHHIILNSIIKTFSVGPEGIKFYSEMEVHDYNGSECGIIPVLPLSYSQFGGFQTVYSLKVV